MKSLIISRPQEILKTSIFFVDPEKLMRSRDNPRNWETIQGKMGLRGELWMGAVGVEGTFGLLIPPAKHDIEAIGYSIKWGEWDWWAFLSCVTLARGSYKVAVSLSFSHGTFFDLSQDIVCCLEEDQLGEEMGDLMTHTYPETSSIAVAWEALWRIFQREFAAELAPPEYQGL
jgi:hypothetical protein